MYSWASPEYLLDRMSLEEVFFYYEQGMRFEEFRAALIIAKLGEALTDERQKKPSPRKPENDKPDKAAFYERHGDKIKRPPKDGETNGNPGNPGSINNR